MIGDVEPEPGEACIRAGAELLDRLRPDLLVAVGGGSVIDAAKAMRLFHEHPEVTLRELTLPFLDARKRVARYPQGEHSVRLVAVPTTSGTGSEVSPAAVITAGDRKLTLVDYSLVPDMAVVDPTLTLTMPPELTADTGIDALTHALEAYVSIFASPYTDAFCLQAIHLILDALPRAVADGSDLRARTDMANAATIAGLAFSNAFLGVNHALAHAVGARFGVAHGRANGVFLPHVLRYNAAVPTKFMPAPGYSAYVAPQKYAQIAWVLGLGGRGEEAARERLFARVDELLREVGIPRSLAGAGDRAGGLDATRCPGSAAPRSPTRAGAPTRACRCSPSSRSCSRPATADDFAGRLESRSRRSGVVRGAGERELHDMSLHGHRVFFRSAGSGPVVVLVHGITSTSATWANVFPYLAERFTVIAPDLMGHGDSAKPRGDYSLGAYASGIRDLLIALGHERATFVGHSLGGGVAMQLAYQFPEHCERLVLVSSGGLGRDITALLRAASLPGAELVLPLLVDERVLGAGRAVGRLLGRVGLRVHTDVGEVLRGHASLSDGEARAAFLHTLRTIVDVRGQRVDASDRLYLAQAIPFLIVWGERDPIIPVAHARAAHELVPGSRLELFPNAGHFPHLDDPLRFVGLLIDFMETTDPARVDADRWGDLLRGGGEVASSPLPAE